jgi:ABC-2 type transport system permease protein
VVRVETAGTATYPATLGRFDLGAGSELILFVFFTAMVSGTALIEARRLGVLRRMAASPPMRG